MATKATHRHHNKIARAKQSQRLCLLLLSVLIFGASKGSAVPWIAEQKAYSSMDIPVRRRVLSGREKFPIARLTASVTPSRGARRWLQSLYRDRDLPTEVHSSPVTLKRQRIARTQMFGPVISDRNRATIVRRALLSEETLEREGHGDENVHEEADSADGSEDEDGAEEGEEDDEEEEAEEEAPEDIEEEHVDVREKGSSKREEVSTSLKEEPQREKPTMQSIKDISQTIRTAADEGSVSEAHADATEEQGSHDEGSAKQESSGRKESGSGKGGSKSGSRFRGVPGGSIDGTNVTHISYMLYKIVKTYEIKTVLDIPCRNNLHWFPELLHQIDFEVIGFKYICVDAGAENDSNLRSRFSEAGSPEFLSIPPTESHNLPKADMVFSNGGPQEWGVRKTWTFFTGLRKMRPKYIIVTNNPGQMNSDKEHMLNFAQAMRVISNVYTGAKPKQLVFYETKNIREGF